MKYRCRKCGIELGPWEGSTCVSCRGWRPYWLGQAEAAAMVLEDSDVPLSVYDVQRLMRGRLSVEASRPAVNAALSRERRFCWGGRGIYGLYRHGLIPGARGLAGVAECLVYSFGKPLEVEHLSFVMKYLGYRFQHNSLVQALNSRAWVKWQSWTRVMPRNDDSFKDAVMWTMAPTETRQAHEARRWRGRIKEALQEYDRRVSR